ncbi:hypothetical protein BU25DRAFT_400670 [Macroventuria anomochaeta]|uniref:Uncharacterized protein n=1 Tax=Macroventuria anomochaeta TaxID=301207 RepID=A0ACB6RNR6_9PLEO|nr:uncharacterized protein BU25DRAFT_400670 [Macroventuria anomochaeta]KAF2623595.1 hypothetical protein BU25DRAFT_400670 [Macroventuria anomochaeta]
MSQGPPYLPRVWALGGAPNKSIDIPVTSICLALYICGAAIHMTILQLNNRRRHKFLFSGALFGFCMSRSITCSLRISSVVYAHNIRLAIAAQIFTAAGVLIIFVINLLWTQRLVRSLHPQFGWHRVPSTILKILWPLIGLTLAVLITATVQSFYTRRPRTLFIDRALQLYGTTFLAILSFLPIPILLLAFTVPRNQTPDTFGRGRLRTKVVVLLTGTVLVCFGASYRAGTMWLTLVQNTSPLPAYYHKAAFYIVDFGVEILTVYLYAITRVDQRFHIPDGARGPGSYSQSEPLGEDGEGKWLELS